MFLVRILPGTVEIVTSSEDSSSSSEESQRQITSFVDASFGAALANSFLIVAVLPVLVFIKKL